MSNFNGLLLKLNTLMSKEKEKSYKQNEKNFSKNIIFQNISLFADRQLIPKHIFAEIYTYAKENNFKSKFENIFNGNITNFTENRKVLHTALRSKNELIPSDIKELVSSRRIKEKLFVNGVLSGTILNQNGEKFKYVVNIGIGGSDLGPKMLSFALQDYKVGLETHYISNLDDFAFRQILSKIDLSKTLFLIASKTFTTQETIHLANKFKNELINQLGIDSIPYHFVGLTTNYEKANSFGITQERIFPFDDWVGGRFSMFSSIGISVALQIGWDNFESLLSGAASMDKHFLESDFSDNLPFNLAAIEIINSNILNIGIKCIVPYSEKLALFTDYISQLDMESLGKNINSSGDVIDYNTGQIIFGNQGTDCQHSYFQLLHQGNRKVSADFIGIFSNGSKQSQKLLFANMLAQSEALAIGKSIDEVKSNNPNIDTSLINHKVFEGNRKSNLILLDNLTPYSLGMLCAMYEHKVYTLSLFWDINAFDQWGVELGKELANSISNSIDNNTELNNSLTQSIIDKWKQINNLQ